MSKKIECNHGTIFLGDCVVCALSKDRSEMHRLYSEMKVLKSKLLDIIDEIDACKSRRGL